MWFVLAGHSPSLREVRQELKELEAKTMENGCLLAYSPTHA